jgi:hypothetical protein
MTSHSTDSWPVVDEPTRVMRAPQVPRRTRVWPGWALTVLAFVCGALVSAAVFTIGWRHQTQANAAAASALLKETARNHRLTASLAAARASIAREKQAAGQALAALHAARASAATIEAQTSAAQSDGTSVANNATAMSSSAGKIANELRTLTTYLTTTPAQQLDGGYVESQASYLLRQVDALQADGASVTSSATNFEAAIAKLERLAAALAQR